MNRTMILPAVIAAGLHVALLGFRSAPRSSAATVSETKSVDFSGFPIVEEEPVDCLLPGISICRLGSLRPPVINQGREPPPVPLYLPFPMLRAPALNVELAGVELIDREWNSYDDGNGGSPAPWILLTPLDNVPQALFRQSSTRPADSGAGAETVTVEFMVGKDGTVSHGRLINSTNPLLKERCLRAVKRWRFEPGMRNNRAVAFRMQQTFVFRGHD